MQEINWIRCPVCGNKTRLQIRSDTELIISRQYMGVLKEKLGLQ
ncbi:MAG: cysteine-rich KTR domain-containing protein [Lachnospiraceae bacterium]|nr:cysteine-rich KTR domain-containing protein [Lachnospiraceae bacterium]